MEVLKLRFGFQVPIETISNSLNLKVKSVKKLLELTLKKEFIEESKI